MYLAPLRPDPPASLKDATMYRKGLDSYKYIRTFWSLVLKIATVPIPLVRDVNFMPNPKAPGAQLPKTTIRIPNMETLDTP